MKLDWTCGVPISWGSTIQYPTSSDHYQYYQKLYIAANSSHSHFVTFTYHHQLTTTNYIISQIDHYHSRKKMIDLKSKSDEALDPSHMKKIQVSRIIPSTNSESTTIQGSSPRTPWRLGSLSGICAWDLLKASEPSLFVAKSQGMQRRNLKCCSYKSIYT